jgi:hypothetical protein
VLINFIEEGVEEAHNTVVTAFALGNGQRSLSQLDVLEADHLAVTTLMAGELEDVCRNNLDGILLGHYEERLQVEGNGPQRVRSGPTGYELKIEIDQRVTPREAGFAGRFRRSDQAREAAHQGMLPALERKHWGTKRITCA